MTNRLDGAVALVTGASSGIGEATALALAASGARVAVAARRTDRLEGLRDKIAASGGQALVLTADVTDERAARGVVEDTVSEYGRLDVVVNNAGVMLLGPIEGADVSEWKRMVDLNLSALLFVSHAALPHLLEAAAGERGVADLVNISSVAGRVARVGSGVYNATKHAVGAFSESLRQEVTGRQVRVGLIEPGAVATELISHNNETVQAAQAERFKEMERLEAEDIAEAISFMVTRPNRMAVNEMLIRPTGQVG